jgi:hypothetical protein
MCYTGCVTETITIRLRRNKSELRAKAKPNINAWVNDLIDQALGPKRADWNEHYRRLAGRKAVARYWSDALRKTER